jgi:hypothetical protein
MEYLEEVEIEPDPFEVIPPPGLGQPGSVKPTLETDHQFCGRLVHRKAFWPIAPGSGRMLNIAA